MYTSAATGAAAACVMSDVDGMPFKAAAAVADNAFLWIWTTTGVFARYQMSSLAACLAPGMLAPDATIMVPGFAPGPGSQILPGGNHFLLAGMMTGSQQARVFVADTQGMRIVGQPLEVDGMKSAILAQLAAGELLVVGVPDRMIGNIAAGQVDAFAFDALTGVLDPTPTLQLEDSQPESGARFGTSLATMPFNGENILVISADDEVFAYYKTALYDNRP